VFDFIVAGGVAWQEENIKSCALQEFGNAFSGVERRVIDDHHIILHQLRDECFLQPFEEEVSIAISGEDDGCEERVAFESGHEIDAFARGSVPLFLCVTALAFRRPSIGIDFVTLHTCFIHPDALFLRNQRERLVEGFALDRVTFAVVGLFFLCVQPIRFNVRLRHIRLTSSSH
jgi:hypothetical protein